MLDSNYLEKSLKPYLAEVEQERLAVVAQVKARKMGIVVAYFGIVAILLAYSVYLSQNQEADIAVSLSLIVVFSIFTIPLGLLVYMLLTKGLKATYSQTIKEKVYGKALKIYNSSVRYHPNEHIERDVFKNAGLFRTGNTYKGEDLCIGELSDGRVFRFSELGVYQKSHQSNNTNSTNRVTILFEGLFYELQLPKTLDGKVKIVPDIGESVFGAVGKFMQGVLNGALKTVSLTEAIVRFDEEYPDFERSYKVYSNQEAVARQIITPAFIEKLDGLKQYTGRSVHIAVQDGLCYFGASTKGFLKVDLNHSLVHTTFIDQLEENLDWCFGLLKLLEELTILSDLPITRNPFDVELPQEGETTPTEKPLDKDKPPVSYKKSNSKDNPFLL